MRCLTYTYSLELGYIHIARDKPICSVSRQRSVELCIVNQRHHRLNSSSSHVLTATSLSYGKAKNSTPTESKPLIILR